MIYIWLLHSYQKKLIFIVTLSQRKESIDKQIFKRVTTTFFHHFVVTPLSHT